MKLDEAVTVNDFIKIYKRKFDENPPNLGRRGSPRDFINQIIEAVESNTPIDIPKPSEDARL